MIMGFWGVVAMMAGSVLLDSMKALGQTRGLILEYTLMGFGFLFLISMTMRFRTARLFSQMYEPRLHIRKKDHLKLWPFVKQINKTSFGRFVLFRCLVSFAVSIASPFWAVYMLRDLGFSYAWFIGVIVAGMAFQLLFFPLMGKMSDRFGNVRVMKISSALLFLIPLLWLLSSLLGNGILLRLYLIFIPSLVAGFAWAGYNLATNNYVYDAIGSRKRSYGLGLMNFFVGIAAFIGAVIGSLLAALQFSFMTTLLFIFLVSGVARLFAFLAGSRLLKEVRPVKKFSSHFLVQEFAPVRGLVREIHHVEHWIRKVEHYI